jgi:hypothetical protein
LENNGFDAADVVSNEIKVAQENPSLNIFNDCTETLIINKNFPTV